MPGITDRSKALFNALAKPDKNNTFSLIPASARRRMLIQFARKQDASVNEFIINTKNTILDPAHLGLQKDGNITAPHDLAVDYPEEDHVFWINDVKLTINPTDIHITQDSHNIKDWVLRSAGMAKVKSGRGVIFVNVSIPFVRSTEINTKLRRIIAQVRTIPIAYIENQLIRQVVYPEDQRRNMAAAITSMNISTHPESPEVVIANVSMEIFNYRPFSDNFLYASFPDAMLRGEDPLKTKNLTSKGKEQSTQGKPKVKGRDLGKLANVQTPVKSFLFTQYYNFILGENDSDIFTFLKKDPKGGGKQDLLSNTNKATKFIVGQDTRKYDFIQVGDTLSNKITFTYHIYHSIPYTVLGKRKSSSKITDADPFSDSSLSASTVPAGPPITGVGSKGINLRNLSRNQISGLVEGNKGILYRSSPFKSAPGELTGKRLNATDITKYIISRFDNLGYSNKKRYDPNFADCSSMLQRALVDLGLGNIGAWTVAQIATLETLSAAGVTAFLRLPQGELVPIPLTINTPARVFRATRDDAKKITKFLRIPGIHVGSSKRKQLSGRSERKTLRPTHVGITVKPPPRSGFNTFEATTSKTKKSRQIRKVRHKEGSLRWEHAYFLPNVVYDYSKNPKEFNELFGLTSDKNKIQGRTISLGQGAVLGEDREAILSVTFKQARERILNDAIGKKEIKAVKEINKKLGKIDEQVTKELENKNIDYKKTAELANEYKKLKKQRRDEIKQLKKKVKVTKNQNASNNRGISKPANSADADRIYKEQHLALAKKARDALKEWTSAVEEFRKLASKYGWELVWTRNGTAIFRKPVKLTIDPSRGAIFNETGVKIITPTQITMSLNNIFARIPIISQYYVTHQFLGSGDAEAHITFHVTGNGPIGQLQYMHKYNETAARIFRRINNVGVITVKNDIMNLTGTQNFIVDRMEITTVPQSPELYQVQLKLTEWKRDQRDRESLKQEFTAGLDARIKAVEKVGRLFNERGKPVIVTNSQIARVGFNIASLNKLGIQVTLGTGRKITIPVTQNANNKINIGPRTKAVTPLDALYMKLAEQLGKFLSVMSATNLFHFLGWTPEAFVTATNDSNHPFNSYGLMEIIGRNARAANNSLLSTLFFDNRNNISVIDVPNKRSAAITNLGRSGKYHVSRSFAINRFLERTQKLLTETEFNLAKKLVQARQAKIDSGDLSQRLRDFRSQLPRSTGVYNKLSSILKQSTRGQISILGNQRQIFDKAQSDFLKKFGPRSGNFSPNITALSNTGQLLQGAINAVGSLNFARTLLNALANPKNEEARLIKKALGPLAENIMKQYPDIRTTVITGYDADTKIKKAQVLSLRDEIRIEQVRIAAALIKYFRSLREQMVSIIRSIEGRLKSHPEFKDIYDKLTYESIKFQGLPAYQDIPLPLVPIADVNFGDPATAKAGTNLIQVNGNNKTYRYINPDFFFFNKDDSDSTNFENITKFAPRIAQYFQSSAELAYQFGMLPSEDFNKITVKAGVLGSKKNEKRDTKIQLGNPGLFAYLGANLGNHKNDIGINKSFSGIPDSLAGSRGLQKLQHRIPNSKTHSGLNYGISDSGIGHGSNIDPYFLNLSLNDRTKNDHPMFQPDHPFNKQGTTRVDRVAFGPSGITELRFPVMLDRRPESIVKIFQKSLISYQRNTLKMRRAFPAFKLYFIEDDTGSILGSDKSSFIRSHDDFFSFSAIKEIKFVRSRKIPADLVIIRLSNLFGYLDNLEYSFSVQSKDDPLRPKDSISAKESSKEIVQDTVAENPFSRFILKEGVRVQLRLGYENDPHYLENEFNGQIVQINQRSADEVVIVCQSFATQLVAYKKGLETKSIPTEWVDTFDLLSWAMCQPEVSYFGRWQLDSKRSFLESRSTGGWEKVFTFLADPRDDNIFTPSRHEMIQYNVDDQGGLISHLWAKAKESASSVFITKANNVEWQRSVGNFNVYSVRLDKVPVYNPEFNSFAVPSVSKAPPPFFATAVKEKNSKKRNTDDPGQVPKYRTVSYATYARGDSGLLDYQVLRTSIWDIFKEMELRHPGWVASPVPYGNRMTMFFGQPSQPYWYRPLTSAEANYQNLAVERLKRKIAASPLLARLNADIHNKAVPYKVVLNKIPVVGTIIRNPLEAIGVGLIVGTFWYYGVGASILGALGRRAIFQRATQFVAGRIAALRGGTAAVNLAARAAAGTGNLGTKILAGSAATLIGGGTTAGVSKAFDWLGPDETRIAYATSMLSMAQDQFTQRELIKYISGRLIPFRRYHLLTSEHHIVANTIKASVHNTYNAVSLEYTKDLNTAADKLGKPSYTETKTMKASDRILDKDVRMGHFSYPNCRGRWMADRYMQGLLIRYMKDTYKGQLLVIGDPSIRPHSRCLVLDAYSGIFGPIDVEQVVHTISPQTGFLTEITPDLVLYGNNIMDMPYDDYMSAKVAYDRMTWDQAIESAIRFQNSPYHKGIRKNAGFNIKGPRTQSIAEQDYFQNRSSNQLAQRGGIALGTLGVAGGITAAATATVGAGLLAGGLVAGAGYYLYKSGSPMNSQLSTWAKLNPFFGTMALKYYEWTTQRQPLIFQPLYLSGRPLLAGVSLDKVGIIQNFKDKFLPVLTKTDRGFEILQQAANTAGLQEFKNYVDQLPFGSFRNETGNAN